MKKLLLSITVALVTLTFSAFTSTKVTSFAQTYFYKQTDGLYYEYNGTYNPSMCKPDPNSPYCLYKWYNSADPGLPPLTQTDLDMLIADGYLISYGNTHTRFIPN